MNPKCSACRDGIAKPIDFSMAFQPIVDVEARRVYAYEALVRGPNGEGASTILQQVTDENRYAFDQSCRVQAITLASRLGLMETGAMLAINFLPGAVYSPAACIRHTLKTAEELGFHTDRLIFEIAENEKVKDPRHLENIVEEYKRHGFRIALDDFGSGYANLNLLADLTADILKIDMALTRNLHLRPMSRAILRALKTLCTEHRIDLIAEGVETIEEYDAIRDCGVRLMQGYLLARPAFEELPSITLPANTPAASQLGLDMQLTRIA